MDPPLKILQEELAAVIAGLTAEQMQQHSSGKWCTAEVLEHLYLTYTGTTKGLSRVLKAQKAVTKPATWIQHGMVVVTLGFGHLPLGREAPSFARPRGLACEKVLAEIASKIVEMDDMIGRCEEKLGHGKLLDHPILGPLTGVQWRKFHLVHGRHHMKQIQRLKKGS